MAERWNRWMSRLALVLLFGAVAVLAVWRLDDPDTWWHLAAGRYIVAQHGIPAHDVFSYTAGERPWIDLHWLFQLLAFGVYTACGVSGLIVLTAAGAVATFGILYRRARSAGEIATLMALALTLLVVHE